MDDLNNGRLPQEKNTNPMKEEQPADDISLAETTPLQEEENRSSRDETPPFKEQWTPPSRQDMINGQWNTPTDQQPTQYHFSGQTYSQFEKTPQKRKNEKKGFRVFAGILAGVFAIVLCSFAALGVYSLVVDGDLLSGGTSDSESSAQINPDGIILNNKPTDSTEMSSSADGKLTAEQVAAKVRPSVCGVVVYSNGLSLQASSQGSGIIITADGYIVTNAHVVGSKNAFVRVVLDNDEEYEAEVIGLDTQTDLAVLKVDAKDLAYAELGNSDQLNVGESVLAIGNPGGLELAGSVTGGMVSALNRNISGYSLGAIQTDAAINPGNSGGALVNMYGQVVGVNSSKIAATEYEGIGFAIAINEAKPIIDDLINYGYVKDRVRIGITAEVITEVTANRYSVPVGLLIATIEDDSDLQNKGVRVGDIITEINGNEITEQSVLTVELEKHKPGDTVKLTIYRRSTSGSAKTFQVEITLMEDRGDN